MDWKNKHFSHEATYSAAAESVLRAARETISDALGGMEDTPDGLTAHGQLAWHTAKADARIVPVAGGTKLTIDLLVSRSAVWGRGFMLADVGSYYTRQIDKWFNQISERLGAANEGVLLSKTTANLKVQTGCFAGCLVYLLVGACLGILAIPLDRSLFSQPPGQVVGPFGAVASGIGLVAGVVAFLYFMYPEAPASKAIRVRLRRARTKD
jgi:hypothetical protein